MPNQTAGEAKLVQYLTEAHGKEKELETSLAAHIAMATRPAYKKRLQEHLKETKQHAKLVERRLKKLGGSALPVKANELASRGIAAAKGPLHAVRGTGEAEKQLKNAKTEYSEEHEEIATYTAIEVLAGEVGDTETAKVAKGIRREEERMAAFLEKQIPLLTKEVVKDEIPKADRKVRLSAVKKPAPRKAAASKPAAKKATAKKPAAKKAATNKPAAAKKPAATKKPAARKRSGGSRATAKA